MLFVLRQLEENLGNRNRCNGMRNDIIALTLLMLFFCLGSAKAEVSTIYDFTGYSSVDIGNTTGPAFGFNYSGSCNGLMGSTNTFTSDSTFDSTVTWYSPANNVIGSGSNDDISNTTCRFYGFSNTEPVTINRNLTSSFYESKYDFTNSADSGYITTSARYQCTSPQTWTNFSISEEVQGTGYCLFSSRSNNNADRHSNWVDVLSQYFDECDSLLERWEFAKDSCDGDMSRTTAGLMTQQYVYPFNTSSGIVRIKVRGLSTWTGGAAFTSCTVYTDIIDTFDETVTNIDTQSDAAVNTCDFDDVIYTGTLKEDRTNLIAVTFVVQKSVGYTAGFDAPDIDFEIFTYRGNFECGQWSECQDGSQYRVCIDQNGIAPPRSETRTCIIGILENATLGFEDFESVTVTRCESDWNIGSYAIGELTGLQQCRYIPVNDTKDRPKNWTIIGDAATFNRDFMDMSTDWASQGSRSLRMWSIPPKQNEITLDSVLGLTCINTSSSDFPEIQNIISNTSLSANFNVTFPASNMRLRFDVRKCNGQVVQSYDKTAFNYSILGVPIFQDIVCPKQCYASSCEEIPQSTFKFDVFDEDLNSIFGSTDFINIDANPPKAETHEYDLTGLGIIPGKNYTISIATFLQNTFDTRGNCILIDNIRYDVLDESFISILGGVCESRCDPSGSGDFFVATKLPSGGCKIRKIIGSQACINSEDAQKINAGGCYCIDTSTLRCLNNFTGLTEDITCDYGCYNDACLTEEDVEEAETGSSVPITGTEQALNTFSFIWSPIFLYMIFSMIISGLLAGGVNKITNGGGGTFQMFGISMLIMVLIGTLPTIGIIPIWVSILVAAVISLLIAKMLKESSFIGGG